MVSIVVVGGGVPWVTTWIYSSTHALTYCRRSIPVEKSRCFFHVFSAFCLSFMFCWFLQKKYCQLSTVSLASSYWWENYKGLIRKLLVVSVAVVASQIKNHGCRSGKLWRRGIGGKRKDQHKKTTALYECGMPESLPPKTMRGVPSSQTTTESANEKASVGRTNAPSVSAGTLALRLVVSAMEVCYV